MFAFITGPLFAFIGPLVTVLWQWLARIFAKSGFYRILGMLSLIDVLFSTINKVFSFFISLLQSKMGSYTLPPDVCFIFDKVGIFQVLSFYVSVLVSFAMAKFFIRITGKLMA